MVTRDGLKDTLDTGRGVHASRSPKKKHTRREAGPQSHGTHAVSRVA